MWGELLDTGSARLGSMTRQRTEKGPAKVAGRAGAKAGRGKAASSGATVGAGTERRGRDADGESVLLSEEALAQIEAQHPTGLTLAQIIDAFVRHGLHLSEATFRKYVQFGLLGRSRRVGRKGKHQGSLGVYPATTVRRINAIKQMMAANYTIEDIQRSFLRFTDEIESLRRSLSQLLSGFEQELKRGSFPADQRRGLARDIQAAQKLGDDLVGRVESLERQLVSPLEREARERAFGAGPKGGAEELL